MNGMIYADDYYTIASVALLVVAAYAIGKVFDELIEGEQQHGSKSTALIVLISFLAGVLVTSFIFVSAKW